MSKVRPDLENKPLVEAIFELRWELQAKGPNANVDPHYKILLGRFYDNVIKDYPFHEELPSTRVPDELVGHVAQHRFRVSENRWPLLQIGPGLITLNDTASYTWKDFEKRAHKLLSALYKAYPKRADLNHTAATLRHIDGLEFDYDSGDILSFLRDKMKIGIDILPTLFRGTGVSQPSSGLDLTLSFKATKPKGVVLLRFMRGLMQMKDALLWETVIQSTGSDVPKTEKGLTTWLSKAHHLSDDWFFKIIEGELFERFK